MILSAFMRQVEKYTQKQKVESIRFDYSYTNLKFYCKQSVRYYMAIKKRIQQINSEVQKNNHMNK